MAQLSKEEAVKLYKDFDWHKFNNISKFLFQISQKKLCMKFSIFHKSTEEALKRPVFTHEFAKPKNLIKEFFNKKT